MQELYRIVKGKLIHEDESNEFLFGLVFDNNGRLEIEIYLPAEQTSILENFWRASENQYEPDKYKIEGETAKGDKIQLLRLHPTSFSRSKTATAKFVCGGRLIYERNSTINSGNGETIYFIELEGLKLEHTNGTENKIVRNNSNRNTRDDFDNWKRDHTTFNVNLIDEESFITKSGEFFNHPEYKENTILEFKDFISKASFERNREYLIHFLSFINGGDVRIRRIYTGNFRSCSEGEIDAHVIELYSFSKIDTEFLSDYVPIHSKWHRSDRSLGKAFLKFENFVDVYKSLGLNSTIYYLNRAAQNNNPEQGIFTLLVALEELGYRHRQLNSAHISTIMPSEQFKPIKDALKLTLETFKDSTQIEDNEYMKLLSRLGDINTRRPDTNEKFFDLFMFGGIDITEEIKQLVVRRHFVIHEGNVGETDDEAWLYYYRLDHILRDIILNKIKYEGTRNTNHLLS